LLFHPDRAKFEMKGEAFQSKQQGRGSGGSGAAAAAAQQQRKRAKGGRGSTKAQLDRLEKKLGWGGFDDKLPPEKVWGWARAGPRLPLLRACVKLP
jgi:hypothetical protein